MKYIITITALAVTPVAANAGMNDGMSSYDKMVMENSLRRIERNQRELLEMQYRQMGIEPPAPPARKVLKPRTGDLQIGNQR